MPRLSSAIACNQRQGTVMNARVVIVGSGGREHALGRALAASHRVGTLYFAGGQNAGLASIAQPLEVDAIASVAPDLVVIGPEAPLVDGLADRLRALGLSVFGPSAAAAQLEASKAFTKKIAAEANIPTAKAVIAASQPEALSVLASMDTPPVVKADGLAAGKGVTVASSMAEAEAAVRAAFAGRFGVAGQTVLLEDRLTGEEVSLFALSDGKTVKALATARDYKRAYDEDEGPNTGGMGAISPAPDLADAVIGVAMERIVEPAIEALRRYGMPYVGVLYAGLIVTDAGPKLIEFNVRFGDPECQVILPRLRCDPFALLLSASTGRLADFPIALSPNATIGVVVAARDYPAGSARGMPIGGINAVEDAGASVIHAGTRAEDGNVLADGGRILTVVASGETVAHARATVYRALERLDFPAGRYRGDIGAIRQQC